MHHMALRESSRLGDMRVNDVTKGIGGMKLSDVIEAMPPDHVSIPIEDTLEDLLKRAPAPYDGISYKLPRVPEWVRAVNPDAYTPKFICIGPYHRGENDNPLRQEELKKDFVNRLWKYCRPDIHKCLDRVRGEVENTRRFYLETFNDINNEEWAMMLLLDGCFFIMHLLSFSQRGFEFPTNWVKLQVKIDLALLENQLPFFILEKIFDLFFPDSDSIDSDSSDLEFEFINRSTALRGMAVYFWVSRRDEDFEAMKTVKNTEQKVHHLVHLIHMAHCDLIDTEPEPKSRPHFKIKKFIYLCLVVLMWVLTFFCKDDEMPEEAAEAGAKVKSVAKVREAVKAIEQALKAGEKAMSAVADAAANAREAAENKKGKAAAAIEAGANDKDKAAVAAVAAEAAAAVENANKAAAMAEMNLKKAEQAAFKAEKAEELAASAANKAEEAKAQAAVAKGKQKAAAMEKVAAAKKEAAAKAKKATDALNKAHRAAAEASAAKLKAAADAWKFAAESANKVREAALKEANMAGVAVKAAKAAQKAMKAAAAADENEMTASPRLKENIASAMELHHLGIQFVTTKRAVGSQYDVRISSNDKDKLVIPPVEVSHTLAPLLHNLIAFEQQDEGKPTKQESEDEQTEQESEDEQTEQESEDEQTEQESEDEQAEQQGKLIIHDHFTKYAFLMYNLINSDEDISLLQKRGILLNNYGTNEQVISYFKKLLLWNSRLPVQDFRTNLQQWNCPLQCQGKASPATPPMAIVRALNALEDRGKHRAYRDWAEAKRHCNSPVQVLLLVTSFLVFVSTIVQTVTSLSGR